MGANCYHGRMHLAATTTLPPAAMAGKGGAPPPGVWSRCGHVRENCHLTLDVTAVDCRSCLRYHLADQGRDKVCTECGAAGPLGAALVHTRNCSGFAICVLAEDDATTLEARLAAGRAQLGTMLEALRG